jgi:hypothetical protein
MDKNHERTINKKIIMRGILRYVARIGFIVGGTYYNQIWSNYRKLDMDSESLIETISDSDFITNEYEIEYEINNDGSCKLIKILDNKNNSLWSEIEEEYARDEYPPFGGPFTNALSPFEWLKLNYNPPTRKK